MAKQMYLVDPENADLWRWEGSAWVKIINAPGLPGWISDSDDPLRRSSKGTTFVVAGQLWLRYHNDTDNTAVVVPVEGLDGSPSYNLGSAVTTPQGAENELWSAPLAYRDGVTWLAWIQGTGQPVMYWFNGDTLVRVLTSIGSGWSDLWDVSPGDSQHQAGGLLMAHDDRLLWGAQGSIGRPAPVVLDRVMKLDPRETSAHATHVPAWTGATDGLAHIGDPWSGDPEVPPHVPGVKAAVAVGSHRGKLYWLRADGILVRVDDFSLLPTVCLDLRNQAGLLMNTFAVQAPTLPHAAFRTSNGYLTTDPNWSQNFRLSRVEVLSGAQAGRVGTLVATADVGGGTEWGMVDESGAAFAPGLEAGDTVTVRFGWGGPMLNDAQAFAEGPVCAAAIVSDDTYLYIVLGTTNGVSASSDSDEHAHMIVMKWTGVLPTDPDYNAAADTPDLGYISDHGSRVNACGLDLAVDPTLNLLHVAWSDIKALAVKHCRVDMDTLLPSPPEAIFPLKDSDFPCAVKPGGLTGYGLYEPSPVVDGTTYRPVSKTVKVDFTLFTASPVPVDNVAVRVDFNTGGAWRPATPKADDPDHTLVLPATASSDGVPYSFIHDLTADPVPTSSLQYRITASFE